MNKATIVVATANQGKIKEIKSILQEYNILSLSDINTEMDVIEDQDTFAKNADKKAKEIANITGKLCLADDSGICIKVFNGWPGVMTARWLKGTDRDRNLGILDKMKGLPKEQRCVSFITALSLSNGNEKHTFVEKIEGYITTECRGNNGFGFDEIFELENGKTLAELSSDEKNEISSRRKALERVRDFLANNSVI